MKRISVSGPWITEKEIAYVKDAVANAWYENAAMYHNKFEKAFADYIGVKYAVALPSCTSAIHLSLLALGINPDDEVIVPDITWIATAAPIYYVRADPVFADVDRQTWCISAESFEKRITPKTKAIIPVDLYGGMPDMDRILYIAKQHNIFVIEDAAEAIGSEYKGKKAGSFGTIGVFSFHGSKTMTTGEGGMLVTNDENIYKRVNFLRDHGRNPGDFSFFNTEIAYKYKMSSMQAALGLAQLERIDELINKKRNIFRWYEEELSGLPGIVLNVEPPHVKNSYWMVSIITDEKLPDKNEIRLKLSEKGIDSRPFFHPLSSLPAYSEYPIAKIARKENIISYQISPHGINLPCGMNLTREDVQYVCTCIRTIL